MKTIKVNPDEDFPPSVYTALENGEEVLLKPKKKIFQLPLGRLSFDITGEITDSSVFDNYVNAGVVRQTKEQAELASKGMLRRNRLSALAEAVGNGEKEWSNDTECYFVFTNHKDAWEYNTSYSYNPCQVYMNARTADAVCEALNSGRFEL